MKEKEIKDVVKGRYARIARQAQESCCPSCGCSISLLVQAKAAGYLAEDLEHVPKEAIMGLGCGNPTAIAELKTGEFWI